MSRARVWVAAALGVLVLGAAAVLPAQADDSTAEPSSVPLTSAAPVPPSSEPVPAAPAPGPTRQVGGRDGAQQAGGGNLPGERPTDDAAVANSDGAPPANPAFVDDYSRVWRRIETGKKRVRTLGRQVVAANRTLAESVGALALAMRVRNLAEFEASDAEEQFGAAVRDLYIRGATDVDVLMGVLGSTPDSVLRTIDSVMYLRSAAGDEATVLEQARNSAVVAQSSAAATQLRTDRARKEARSATTGLARAKKQLADDQAELARLVSVAQPQTVVGPTGCPTEVLAGTLPDGISVKKLCKAAVRNASSAQAAFAIKWAMVRLGAPYACEGIGRLAPWRYDCSSYVSRAYAEGAGLRTAGDGWAPSTRNMVPWDGASLDPHYAVIPPGQIRPGDLVLYDTCPAGQTCSYRHVVMYLGPQEKGGVPMMAHTNACGSVAHVSPFTGTQAANFLGVRRVVPLAGERVKPGALTRPGAS